MEDYQRPERPEEYSRDVADGDVAPQVFVEEVVRHGDDDKERQKRGDKKRDTYPAPSPVPGVVLVPPFESRMFILLLVDVLNGFAVTPWSVRWRGR